MIVNYKVLIKMIIMIERKDKKRKTPRANRTPQGPDQRTSCHSGVFDGRSRRKRTAL
jgi:hypothetical protein